MFALLLALLACPRPVAPEAMGDEMARTVEVPVFEGPLNDWVVPPIVVVCPDSPLDVDEVQALVAEWADHGAPYLLVERGRCLTLEPEFGRVYVRGVILPELWSPGTLGATYFSGVPGRDVLLWAIVSLQDSDPRVALHEIGHIWLPHSHARPHVMAPAIEWYGDDWTGVRAAFIDAGLSP